MAALVLNDPIGSCSHSHSHSHPLFTSSLPAWEGEDHDDPLAPLPSKSHFPVGGSASTRRLDPRYRYAWDRAKYARLADRAYYRRAVAQPGPDGPAALLEAVGPHHRAGLCANGLARRGLNGFPMRRRAWPKAARRPGVADVREGRELAAAQEVALPGDRAQDEGRALGDPSHEHKREQSRSGRPPSLERQEAFWDERTLKRRGTGGCSSQGSEDDGQERGRTRVADSKDGGDNSNLENEAAAEAAAVEELYHLGLLYDDEHVRGSSFSFSAITHDEPLYALSVRGEKRGRKRRALDVAFPHRSPAWDERMQLSLGLSFAAIGDDDAIARFLISPDETEEEETEELYDVTEEDADPSPAASLLSPPLTPRARPVELDLSEEDLMQEATYLGSQHEAEASAAHADDGAPVDFPMSTSGATDLDLETPHDFSTVDNTDSDDNDDDNDWAILRDGDTQVDAEDAAAPGAKSAADNADTLDTRMTADPDAWVVLG